MNWDRESELGQALDGPVKQRHQSLPHTATPAPTVINKIDALVSEREIKVALGNRLYRVRVLAKNQSYEGLKVTVMVSVDDLVYVDTLRKECGQACCSCFPEMA